MTDETDDAFDRWLDAELAHLQRLLLRRKSAQAIEAHSGETAQPVRSEGRKRGPKGAPKGDAQ